MKIRAVLGVIAVVATLSICAVAGTTDPSGGFDEVMFKGQLYCVGVDDCQAFAFWGPTAAGYVELLESPNGPVSDYIWVDFNGFLTFESDDNSGGFAKLPPAGLPFLGSIVENGSLQNISQFFPGSVTRPLEVESTEGTPEPSTILLFGPAALFMFGRARRFWRG